MTKEVEDKKVEPAVNMDALVAPEGTPADHLDQFKETAPKVESSQTTLYGLPNLDREMGGDDIDKGPDGSDKKVEVTDKPKETVAPVVQAPADDKWFHKPFRDLQKKLDLKDDEFKMPEGITEENYLEKYNEILYANTEFEDDGLDPEIKNINELVKKGMPVHEAIQTYQRMNDVISLPDKDLVELSLKEKFGKNEKRKEGWDDEKIKSQLTKMENGGMLEIEAENIRSGLRNEKSALTSKFEQESKQQSIENNKKLEQVRTEEINKSIEYLKGMKEVYGVPVSKAESQEFENDFRYLVTPKENGVSPLAELLQSNENLVRVAYFLSKGDTKVKEALTKAKEDAKKSVIDKLDDKTNLPKKNGVVVDPAAVDLDKLSEGAKN